MRILLIQSYDKAVKANKKYKFEATVEAEYGDHVIEGSIITLAHHVDKYKKCIPPSLYEHKREPINGNILISHIDLDTIGGVLELIGKKPNDDDFWEGVAYIDENGAHIINFLDEKVRNKLNAYYAWKQTIDFPISKPKKVIDVTKLFYKIQNALEKIINEDKELIKKGIIWRNELEQYFEDCLVYEDEQIRCFKSKKISTAAAYYSKKYKKNAICTISYSMITKQITIAFSDHRYNAKNLVKSIWGNLAGGHDSIAGSPRGMEIKEKSLDDVIRICKDYIKRCDDEANNISRNRELW